MQTRARISSRLASHGDASAIDLDGGRARALAHRRRPLARPRRQQVLIEDATIDDDRFDFRRRVRSPDAPAGDQNRAVVSSLRSARRDRLNSGNASAASTPVQCTGSPTVGCSSSSVVRKPAPRKTRGGIEPRGPSADDDDVLHRGHSTRVQNFLPRVSHVPRNVIQNDSRISRTSSQNDCCRM